jgi:pantothenate kinase type III
VSRLLVNAGNTRCIAARQTADAATGPLQQLLAVDTPGDRRGAAELAVRLAGLLERDETMAVASVVPLVSEALTAELPRAQLVDQTWDFPFATDLIGTQTVGADRWCNVAAAAGSGLRDAMIVDAGTATTIDILDGGVFLGGLIAPGMAFAAERLQETAPRLWRVPFASCALRAGRDTEEALRIGAFHVGVHGVVGVVQELLARHPRARVVLTGGLGVHLARADWPYDPDWTLRGLSVLADRRARAA